MRMESVSDFSVLSAVSAAFLSENPGIPEEPSLAIPRFGRDDNVAVLLGMTEASADGDT
jgi:hypothetical protein